MVQPAAGKTPLRFDGDDAKVEVNKSELVIPGENILKDKVTTISKEILTNSHTNSSISTSITSIYQKEPISKNEKKIKLEKTPNETADQAEALQIIVDELIKSASKKDLTSLKEIEPFNRLIDKAIEVARKIPESIQITRVSSFQKISTALIDKAASQKSNRVFSDLISKAIRNMDNVSSDFRTEISQHIKKTLSEWPDKDVVRDIYARFPNLAEPRELF